MTIHDKKQQSQDRFGQFATHYVTSGTHARGAELATLVNLARPQPHWRVLDIAMGGGHTALAFAPHVAEVFATDITQAAAFITAQGVDNVRFKEADAENLPFDDRTFDLVTC